MDPLIALLRDGRLAIHKIQGEMDPLLRPAIEDTVARMLPAATGVSIVQAVQAYLDANRSSVTFQDLDATFVRDLVFALTPAIIELVRTNIVATPAIIATVRGSIIPIGYDDIHPSAWPLAVERHVSMPQPGSMRRDEVGFGLFADSHAVVRYDAASGVPSVAALDVGRTRIRESSAGAGLRAGDVDISGDGSGGVTISGASGVDLVTARSDAFATRGPIVAPAVVAHDSVGGGGIALFPAPIENAIECRGPCAFRVVDTDRQIRSLLLARSGRVVVNPALGQNEGVTGDALEVNGGASVDTLRAQRIEAGDIRVERLTVGPIGESGAALAALGHHSRISVPPRSLAAYVVVPNPFGAGAVVHASFMGPGSVSVTRIDALTAEVLVNSNVGGELMVSMFGPSPTHS
jgi:hypothetical protein